MDFLVIFIILFLVGIAFWLILYPLWQQQGSNHFLTARSGQLTLEEYEAQYQAALAAVKDLGFDHEMDKVSTEDYEIQMTKAKLEAARIRHQLELLSSAFTPEPVDNSLDIEVEQMIIQLREDNPAPSQTLLAEVEAEIEGLKKMSVLTSQTCRHCGKLVRADDLFCSACGQPVDQLKVYDEPDTGTCPECGYSFQPGDVFCARCGASLTNGVPAQNYEDAKI